VAVKKAGETIMKTDASVLELPKGVLI
jgi:hypothetical protein